VVEECFRRAQEESRERVPSGDWGVPLRFREWLQTEDAMLQVRGEGVEGVGRCEEARAQEGCAA
jgi:hypothetical protein